MVGHRFLLVTALLFTAGIHAGAGIVTSDPPTGGCSTADALNGTCNIDGQINDGGVTLSGHKNAPGSGGSGKSSGTGKSKPDPHTCPPGTPAVECSWFSIIPPGGPGNPAVTINDLKNFRPVPGTDHMQPNGWMVVGLDTNFYSVVGVEIQNGILLGQSASVRFTPISWHWTYGDATAATRSTPGATWAAQGIPEFDPTPTSHVYTADGTYFIDLSITFRAEYKYATGNWTPVVGTITLPANRLEASAGDAKTVLVNHDCAQNPSGPGC
ncbi:MAG TPA: hypothetical protein VK537_01955 [Galbitalea sp.]|nr:hypothetical protein [Galbitalea sp.]